MSDSFDVIVIGGGPAGYPAAIRAAQNKLNVACIDGWKNRDGSSAFGGADQLLDLRGLSRANDGRSDGRMPQGPRDRHFARRAAVFIANGAEPLDQRFRLREHRLLEKPASPPEIVCGQGRQPVTRHRSGEQPRLHR